jgi:hypothetical protein
MRRIAVFLFCFVLGCGVAGAQEQVKGWLGVELKDITREEAEALGWESPRGGKTIRDLVLIPTAFGSASGLFALRLRMSFAFTQF